MMIIIFIINIFACKSSSSSSSPPSLLFYDNNFINRFKDINIYYEVSRQSTKHLAEVFPFPDIYKKIFKRMVIMKVFQKVFLVHIIQIIQIIIHSFLMDVGIRNQQIKAIYLLILVIIF